MSSLTSKVINNSMALLFAKIIDKSIGLVSLMILARLLTKDDFGVMAIVMLVLYFFESLALLGILQYLIQKTTVTDEDLDGAFTLQLSFRITIWIIFLILIPYIDAYYAEANLTNVLYFVSIVIPIGGLKNPGFSMYRRDMVVKPILILNIVKKTLSFSALLIALQFTHSYWVMAIGSVVMFFSEMIITYVLHPYRPSINFKPVPEQWKFTQWILYRSVLGFTRSQIDLIVLSAKFNLGQVGEYNIIKDISVNIGGDFLRVILAPFIPAYAISKREGGDHANKFLVAIFFLHILLAPVCFFIWFFPESIINFLLGEQWLDSAWLLRMFVFFLYSVSIIQLMSNYCMALGKVKSLFMFDLISSISIFAILYYADFANVEDFALTRGITGMVMMSILFLFIMSFSKVRILDFLLLVILSTVISYFSVYSGRIFLDTLQINFLATIFIGMAHTSVVYIVLMGASIFILKKFSLLAAEIATLTDKIFKQLFSWVR